MTQGDKKKCRSPISVSYLILIKYRGGCGCNMTKRTRGEKTYSSFRQGQTTQQTDVRETAVATVVLSCDIQTAHVNGFLWESGKYIQYLSCSSWFNYALDYMEVQMHCDWPNLIWTDRFFFRISCCKHAQISMHPHKNWLTFQSNQQVVEYIMSSTCRESQTASHVSPISLLQGLVNLATALGTISWNVFINLLTFPLMRALLKGPQFHCAFVSLLIPWVLRVNVY